ncbi:LADA_0A04940g1_1 [Lachancea dasiensis]|uniref:LADA_0A04940g1_1 n=1 Tax=Lachancea dasiensis TaxID=1072105 RepID=A0A1G4INN9_9SACH|nr:LADA_0A04940g1_1 [Lachancea dasiensis]
MLSQTIRGTRALQSSTLRSIRTSIGVRSIVQDAKSQVKSPEGVSQAELDANKKKLEDLEKKAHSKEGLQRPSREELKKKGEDAQVEQQRPDDGVY